MPAQSGRETGPVPNGWSRGTNGPSVSVSASMPGDGPPGLVCPRRRCSLWDSCPPQTIRPVHRRRAGDLSQAPSPADSKKDIDETRGPSFACGWSTTEPASPAPLPCEDAGISHERSTRLSFLRQPRALGTLRNPRLSTGQQTCCAGNLLRFLNVHHEGEDALIWPKLVARVPVRADLVQEMASDQKRIDGLMRAVAEALPGWLDVLGRPGCRPAGVVPLCADHLSPAEWREMPARALAAFDGDKVWMILGLIRPNMDQEQRVAMLAHIPPPARDMWVKHRQRRLRSVHRRASRRPRRLIYGETANRSLTEPLTSGSRTLMGGQAVTSAVNTTLAGDSRPAPG
jgi:hypothetical protein